MAKQSKTTTTSSTHLALIWRRGKQKLVELLLQRLKSVKFGERLELTDLNLAGRSLMFLQKEQINITSHN